MDDLLSRIGLTVRSAIGRTTPVPYGGGHGSSALNFFNRGSNEAAIAEKAYAAHGGVGTLFAIVGKIGDAFVNVKWHTYRRTSVRDAMRRNEILAHPFVRVWNSPNPFYSGSGFREAVQQHLDLVGEGAFVFNELGGVIYEMWPIRPDRLEPVPGDKQFLAGYLYHGPDGEKVPLTTKQVGHIKLPNPADPYRGRGPVQTALLDLDSARYSAEWNRNFFINGAQPGGIIKVPYRMHDTQYREFLARWREQHQGVANAHRVALLENAEWESTKFTMEDMQFTELRNLSRELIREALAFPKPMLGTVDDVNRANSDAAKEIMAESITTPRANRWADYFSTFILPRFFNGSTLVLDFDDPTPINREAADRERNSKADAASKLVAAGYDGTAVAEAMGLPAMPWQRPGSTPATPIDQAPIQATAIRGDAARKIIIERAEWHTETAKELAATNRVIDIADFEGCGVL